MKTSKLKSSSLISQSRKLLNSRDKAIVLIVIILQIIFGFLDLIGVMLIGVVGALAATGISTGKPGNRVSTFLNWVGLSDATLQTQVTIVGLLAATLLICKTMFSVYFTRKSLLFLSRRGAKISAQMVNKLLRQSLLTVQGRSLQANLYAVTTGVTVISVGVLGTLVLLVADSSLLIVMIIGLFVVDSSMALGTLFGFGAIGYALWLLMHKRAANLGAKSADLSVENSESIFEVLSSYREAVVRGRRGYYANLIGKQRFDLANMQAEMSFMPSISKYVIEISVVLISIILSGYQFLINDAGKAVAVLAVFLAATTRIAPAVLRIQQSLVSMRGSLATAQPTLDLLNVLGWEEATSDTWLEPDYIYKGFSPEIRISKLTFTYPEKIEPVLEKIDLQIKEGELNAIVGESGAGKTTLVDLILGILNPTEGRVLISGLEPLLVVKKFPGAIAYVPQDVILVNGTIRKNVTLGYNWKTIDDERIWEALKIAHMKEFVSKLPEGLDSPVGDRGTKLSGGQRQRLGIARAMLTKPKLLVLDEATSSLDGQLESDITESIQEMKGKVTVLMIAHRLSSVRNADCLIYLENGKVAAIGNFEDVRKAVPNFDRQASLMGLH